MTHDESYIEILISKHLDGEISATEQRHLQETLDRDPQTRELFEELTALYQASQTALGEVFDQGKPAEEVLAAAWNQTGRITWWHKTQNVFYSQFTTGLAAGLLIALSLQMATQRWPSATRTNVAEMRNPIGQTVIPVVGPNQTGRRHYVDEDGRLWIAEGSYESQTQPASYRQDF